MLKCNDYNYYANQLDAGSADEKQLYVNPVNCCLCVVGRMEEEYCKAELPPDYELACGLEKTGKHSFKASYFDNLAGHSFIASNSLKHDMYEVKASLFIFGFRVIVCHRLKN